LGAIRRCAIGLVKDASPIEWAADELAVAGHIGGEDRNLASLMRPAPRGRQQGAIVGGEQEGRPIAIFLHLVAAGYAATFKITHDEELARHAPGVATMRRCLEGAARRAMDEAPRCGSPPRRSNASRCCCYPRGSG
jgi:hypothetical protein